jgi:hypothetical protein
MASSLDFLDNVIGTPKYRESEFAHLSVKQLQMLAGSFTGYEAKDPAVEILRKKYLQGKDKDEATVFKMFIIALKTRKAKGSILEAARIEETAHQKGSTVSYSETQYRCEIVLVS